MCQHTDPGMTLKHRDLTHSGRVATKGHAKTVSYDKQSVLEGTWEFHLVTFIMLIQFVFATLIIWYVGGPVMTHKYMGSIVAFSVSKSVAPNEEQKEMTSGFQQGNVCKCWNCK